MSSNNNVFIPNISSQSSEDQAQMHSVKPDRPVKDDAVSSVLLKVSQYSVIALLGLTAVFFTPGLYASLNFDKALLVIVLGLVSVMSVSFLALRRSRVHSVIPLPLLFFWLLVVMALASGLLSGDAQDALRGSVLETQTVAFLAVLGLAMSIPLILQGSRLMSIKALSFFGITTAMLLLYNVLRVFFGAEFLSLGSFGSVTASPVGGFNDLALFSAVVVILGLITLVQLPLKTWGQIVISALIVMALTLMAVVNFFNVWIVVGFFGLLLFLYLISRDTLFDSLDETPNEVSKTVILMTAIVCVVSAVFVVAGDYAGGKISAWADVQYVEVRPSFSATTDIASEVLKQNALLGIGPNRFSDSWRLYKDTSINETIFWDTDFTSGSGYVPTMVVNLGFLGGLLMVITHALYIRLGYRMLLRSGVTDPYWYYFGLVSFSAASFIWGMSYIYVPGASVLILGALFTGCSFAAAAALLPSGVKTIPLTVSRRRGFVLMAAAVCVISVSIASLLTVGKQYVAQSGFVKSQQTATTPAEFDQAAAESYNLYPDDRFLNARSQIRINELNSLLGLTDPTETEQQQFLLAAEQGLVLTEQAILDDVTNPDHHALMAGIYNSLATAGIEGAQDRADAALAKGRALDPLNPGYFLLMAQAAVRAEDPERAREELIAALQLKRNYTPALLLLAQLDISEGNTDNAIATTQAIITLEPNNPTRYFQLGVLLTSSQRLEEAVGAFARAIQLDPQYANARYMLSLALLDLGESELALEQLRIVEETNQENIQLKALITQIESGDYQAPDLGQVSPVSDSSTQSGEEDAVITDSDVSTDLVNPVNTIPDSEGEDVNIPDVSTDDSGSEGETTNESDE